jgi:hypothetical protein
MYKCLWQSSCRLLSAVQISKLLVAFNMLGKCLNFSFLSFGKKCYYEILILRRISFECDMYAKQSVDVKNKDHM